MKNKFRRFIACLLVIMLMSSDMAVFAESVIKTLTLPAGLKVIEDEAFYGDSSIEKVIVPDGTTEIGSRAFADSSLTEIELPDTLKHIEDDVFEHCDDLTVIAQEGTYAYDWAVDNGYIEPVTLSPDEYFTTEVLDDGTLSITGYTGENADVVIPSMIDGIQVTEVGEDAFNGHSDLMSISIPEGVTSIGYAAFENCGNLSSIAIPDSVSYVGAYAFRWCSNLSNIILPYGVTSIKPGTFQYCSNLAAISIPDSVTTIGNNAFYFCKKLTNINIPTSVTSIGQGAFYYCNSLTSVDIPDGVTMIDQDVFAYCSNLARVTLPENSTSKFFGYSAFAVCSSLKSIRLPKGITTILRYAFSGCVSLDFVGIPEGVMYIDDYVFNQCISLKGITIPDSVTYIADNAFEQCTSLTTIYGKAGSIAEEFANQKGYKFVEGVMSEPDTLPTVSNFTLNSVPTEITVAEGYTLSFGGVINAGSAQLVNVQASIFDADDREKGVIADRIEGVNANTFNLADINPIIVGREYSDDEHSYAMEAGKSYVVMLYVTDANGNGFIDYDPNIEGPQGPSILVHVEEKEEELTWKVSHDTYYNNLTVEVASGIPDADTSYLFVAEDANGLHYPGDSTPNIPAGATSATFGIKKLQMKRAKAYDLYVLPAGVSLTDDNRSQYRLEEKIVVPLWSGNMIYNVYSGDTDVTGTKKLHTDEDIKVVWEASYGVYNVEVSAKLNGQVIFTETYTDPKLIDGDDPVTTTIDSSCFNNAKTGNELEISVTVIPTEEAQSLLVGAEKEPTENSSWKGLIKTPVYRAIAVAMDLNDDIVQDAVDIPLWPFDNYDYTISTDAGVADYITMWGAFRESSKCEYSTINVKYAPAKNEFEFMVNSLINEGICEGDVTVIFVSAHGGRTDDLSIHGVRFSDEWMYTDELHDIIAAIPGTVVLVLNCCYSGAIIDEFSDSETNVAIITACSKAETAGFYAGEYSLMPHYLGIGAGYDYNIGVTGLLADQDGDDAVSIQEWFDFASANVSATMQEDGGIQTMKICASNKLRELVLFAR